MAQHRYEGSGILERLREFRTLFIFIIASSAVSLLVMNLLSFPIALFAVTKPAVYTFAVKIFILVSIICFIIFRIIRRIQHTRDNGIPIVKAFSASIASKMRMLSSFLLVAVISIILIVLFYIILRYNYIILYELMQ